MINNWNFEKKENYYPKIAVVYLGDKNILNNENDIKFDIKYNLKYLRISSNDIAKQLGKTNEEYFFSWKKEKGQTLKSKKFFSNNYEKIISILKNVDIAIIIGNVKEVEVMQYIVELNEKILKNLDILSFNFLLEDAWTSKKAKKAFIKLKQKLVFKNSQIISLNENEIMTSFLKLEMSDFKLFISKTINKLVDSFISPFLRVVENPFLFRKLKYFIYKNQNNSNLIMSTLAISREKSNRLEDALYKSLLNPVFQGAFNASDLLLVNIKGVFVKENHKQKLELKLKEMFGVEKNIIVTYYEDNYSFDRFTQISIFAFFVESKKLVKDLNLINSMLQTNANLPQDNFLLDNLTQEVLAIKKFL